MKIRVLKNLAGRTFAYGPGAVVELEAAEARRWIAAGFAAPLASEPETAARQAPERAVKKRGKPKS